MDSPDHDPTLARHMDTLARRDMEHAESQAAALAARKRELVEVCWLAVQSGDHVTARVAGIEIAGTPTYARGDLLSIETRYGSADVNLAAVEAVTVAPGRGKGLPVPHEAESFAARLGLLQLASETVELVSITGWRFSGTLVAVARDHIVAEGSGSTVHLRLAAVAAALRQRDDNNRQPS